MALSNLIETPFPPDAQELRDMPGVYRKRLDGWRIIYEVDRGAETIAVLAVRYKRGPETYQDLSG